MLDIVKPTLALSITLSLSACGGGNSTTPSVIDPQAMQAQLTDTIGVPFQDFRRSAVQLDDLSGTASFEGIAFLGTHVESEAILGNVSLDADFADASVSGTVNGLGVFAAEGLLGPEPELLDELEGELRVDSGLSQGQSIVWVGTIDGTLTNSEGGTYFYDTVFEGSIGRSGDSDALIGNGLLTGNMRAPDGTVVTEGLGGIVVAGSED